jgi:conjugal transfer pilus assembly protein TraD
MSREARRRLSLAALLALLLAPAPLRWPALAGALVAVGAARAVLAFARRTRARRLARGSSGAMLLGLDPRGRPVALSERELAAHALILGASGAGKTTSLLAILTERVLAGAPVVALDLKGSPAFASELAHACAAAARQLRVWTPEGPERWNPLGHGNPTELKDRLIASERFSEPHYQRAAERYLQRALAAAAALHSGAAPTLAEVVALLDPNVLASRLRGLPPALSRPLGDYLSSLTHDQLSAVRGLQTRLAVLSESHCGPYLQPAAGGIDLHAALDGRDVVLFSLPSSRYGKLAAQVGTLAVQELVAATGRRLAPAAERLPHAAAERLPHAAAERLPHPPASGRLDPLTGARTQPLATIAIDEFSALGADHVLALLARGRESGVSVLLATQELADLERAARGLRDQVLGNTALKLVHRQEVPSSAETLARLGGTREQWEYTYQLGAGLLGRTPRARASRRWVKRLEVSPDAIRALGTGEALRISAHAPRRAQIVRVAPPRTHGQQRRGEGRSNGFIARRRGLDRPDRERGIG